MAEGIFGLIGVLVGASVAGWVTLRLERRREKREALAARRIVKSELEEAKRAVQDALAGREWPPGWDETTWTQTWSTNRSVLAATMNGDHFDKLADVYLQMRLLQRGLAAGTRTFARDDETFLHRVETSLRRGPSSFGL
jgi:hypothetical protein